MCQQYCCDKKICDCYVVVAWDATNLPSLFKCCIRFYRMRKFKWYSDWKNYSAWMISDMTCITSLLDIPRFSVSILTIISSTYFTWFSYNNTIFFIGRAFSYVIVFLPILWKALNTVCLGTGSKHNSKQASSHFPLKDGYQLFTRSFFGLGQSSSVHQ